MRRAQQLDRQALKMRLTAVKRMVAGTKDAMPTMAAELRREACETIDDVIEELSSAA